MKFFRVAPVLLGALAAGLSWAASESSAPVAEPALRVVDLRTENQVNPIGIDEATPLLAWKLASSGAPTARGQQAYEIRSAASVEALERGGAEVRSSGKVASADNSGIPLTGIALQSRQTVAWQVRVWDDAGHVSAWSAPATFEMGLLGPNDWTARWIENASYNYTQPDGSETPLPVFEKDIPITGAVARARLYMTGLGMYAASINGAAVSNHVLEPGQTTYAAEVNYRTYDLTARLERGRNLLRVETGSGAYQRVATPGRYFFGNALEQHVTYGEPKIIAQLEITYADGRRQIVASDASWRTTLGATTFSSWWSGEEYDARRARAKPRWQNAALVQLSATTTPTATTPLRADPRPPVVVAETIEPGSVRAIGGGSYILDFGANRSGWPSVHLAGKAGTTITMTPSELLNADGTLDVGSTGARPDRKIAYRYTFAGAGVETWQPKFTYNGFRYLQVDGLAHAPDKSAITMMTLYAANPRASAFESSSTLLQQIHEITLRAMQSNMMSVLTDCPDREKGPYTGDNVHNLDALLTDYDMSAYEPQLVRNMATAQRKPGDISPGLIANIAPEFHRVRPDKLNWPQGVIEFLDEVNWGGGIVRIPYRLYREYGDTRTMARYYDNMIAWLDYVAATKAANKGDIPGLGDWSAHDNTTPMQLAILAGYYTAADDMAKIAEALGKKDEEAKYRRLADDLSTEFNSRFRHVDAHGVFYGSDSETSNAMALDAGLVAPADVAQVRARLIDSIRRAGNHITSGSVGLGPLFRALEDAGRNDVLYDMVVNPTSPGYGYFITAGYTTLPEDFAGGGSQNHHFLGQVDAWLINGVAGIRQAPDSVAYQKVEITPAQIGVLSFARGKLVTVKGTIESAWERKDGQLRVEVTVPIGVTADVHVPVSTGKQIAASGAGGTPTLLQRSASQAVYTVGAGSYTFSVAN